MEDDKDSKIRSDLRRTLEKLAQGKGVQDENLLEALEGELSALRGCWGINLKKHEEVERERDLRVARNTVLLNLEAHIRKLDSPPKVPRQKYLYVVSVSFNIYADKEHVPLKEMDLSERREWLFASAREERRVSGRTSGRYLSHAINQIEQQIRDAGYEPVRAKDMRNRPSVTEEAALLEVAATPERRSWVRIFLKKRLVISVVAGVVVLIAGLVVALDWESITNTNLSTSLGKAPDLVNGRPVANACSPTLSRSRLGQGNAVQVALSQKEGDSRCWTPILAPITPGATLRYLITYQNDSLMTQNNVGVRISLAPGLALVPNSTYLFNSTNPHGLLVNSNNVSNGGIIIGGYVSGGDAFVLISVALPFKVNLRCGTTDIRSVGVARPEGMSEYYNTAITDAFKQC